MDAQQLDRADSATVAAMEAPSKEEVVTLLFEAFSRREMDDALALLDPEIVFQPVTAEVTRDGEPYRGHEGMHRYMADVEATWEELTVHPTRIRAAGDAVVAMGMAGGSARDGGSFEDVPTTWMFKFRKGLVIQIQIFSDPSHAREALGEEAVKAGRV
jgi:ketosteroid isomerase-like protein